MDGWMDFIVGSAKGSNWAAFTIALLTCSQVNSVLRWKMPKTCAIALRCASEAGQAVKSKPSQEEEVLVHTHSGVTHSRSVGTGSSISQTAVTGGRKLPAGLQSSHTAVSPLSDLQKRRVACWLPLLSLFTSECFVKHFLHVNSDRLKCSLEICPKACQANERCQCCHVTDFHLSVN